MYMKEGECFQAEIECRNTKKTLKVIVFCSDPLQIGFPLSVSEDLWKKIKKAKSLIIRSQNNELPDKEWIVAQEVDVAHITWFICREGNSDKKEGDV